MISTLDDTYRPKAIGDYDDELQHCSAVHNLARRRCADNSRSRQFDEFKMAR